jgi:hypothetical protein
MSNIRSLEKLQTTRSRVRLVIPFIVAIHIATKGLLLTSWLYVCPSVCLYTCKRSARTGRIFVKFTAADFYKIVCREPKFRYNVTKMSDNLIEDLNTLHFSHNKEIFCSLATVKMGKRCCILMAIFSICILFTSTSKSTVIKREIIVVFTWQQW